MTLSVILASAAVLIALAALAIPLHAIAVGRILVYGGSLLVAVVGLATALYALIGQIPTETLVLPLGLPWIGAHFRLDALSAFFLVVVNLGGAAPASTRSAMAGTRRRPQRVLPFYPAVPRRHEPRRARRRRLHLPARLGVHVARLLGAGAGAPSASRDNVRAGYIYLRDGELRHAGAAARFRPARAARTAATLSPPCARAPASAAVAALVLILALIGAGSKAGLVPLHVWLPLAHPAAPSHVSALMSGVMTKVAVYGFIRIVFDLLGAAGLVVERGGARARRHHLRAWACCTR